MKRVPIPGQVVGMLTVIGDTGKYDKHRNSIWLFRCACGKEKEIIMRNVFHENTVSCGCLRAWKAKRRMQQLVRKKMPLTQRDIIINEAEAHGGSDNDSR